MKKLIILSAIAMSGLIYNTADAQIGIQVGFHFGHPRVYAPAPVVVEQAPVYDNDNDYYYLPDVNAYYNVSEQCYYYFDGDNWVTAEYLPGQYSDFDWRNARRFEVRAERPYLRNEFYRSRYNGRVIGDWGRGNSHNFNGGYANADRFNRDNHYDGNRFNDRGFRGDDHNFNNRGRDGFNEQPQYREQHGNDQHFENHGNFNQPQQNQNREQHDGGRQNDNHGQGGSFNQQQPQQNQNREQHNNGQGFDNHSQGQSAQPANQNHQRDDRGGNEHFSQNNHGGNFTQRMGRM